MVFKVTALLDTSAEINVITKKDMEDAGLTMQCDLKLELMSYTNYSHLFLGFCKDIEIVIEELTTRHPIFLIEQEDHDLVLG